MRVDGNRVRISAELVEASTSETVWSNQVNRELSDIPRGAGRRRVQIARALHANLSPAEKQRVGARPTDHPEAYTLYLESQQMGPIRTGEKSRGDGRPPQGARA